MLKQIKRICQQYTALVVMCVYAVVYLTIFNYLEQKRGPYHIIHVGIDDYIPFCEYFIVPYILWFFYVAIAVFYFAIKDKEEGKKLIKFLIAGMTVFLFVSSVYPNGLHLRPRSFTRDNIFIQMVQHLYRIDTSTNVIPSIHVYNSIAVMIAVWRTELLKKHKLIKWSMLLLGASIICSTVLIKQHSVLDVMTAFILSGLVYAVCYRNVPEGRLELEEASTKLKY